MFQFRKRLSSGALDEPVPRSCHIHQSLSVIVADDQGVNAMRSGKIAANDELLATIHAILDLVAASFSRLVVAVLVSL